MLRWAVVLLAMLVGGWMAFDGLRALILGDYVTAAQGPYAGQLGPWAALLGALGIDPRSLAVKLLLAGLGITWLASALGHAAGLRWAAWALLICAACCLWYLPFGTLAGLADIVLLLVLLRRGGTAASARPG